MSDKQHIGVEARRGIKEKYLVPLKAGFVFFVVFLIETIVSLLGTLSSSTDP